MANLGQQYKERSSRAQQYSYPPGKAPSSRPTIVVEPRDSRSSRRERVKERDHDYDYSSDERRQKLYGERGAGIPRDPRYDQPTSYNPEDVSFTPRYDMDDVRFASSSRRDRDRSAEFAKPNFSRSTTYVY